MQKISENILIETDHFGVTLGAIIEEENVMFVDAPLLPEHQRVWKNTSTKKKKLNTKLVILDSHPDRTIGSRFFECSIVAQEEVMQIYQNRPITFKPVSLHSGSDWEKIKGMNGFRWAYPEIVFSRGMDFHQESLHIIPEYHPGPSIGSSWVHVPEQKVVFIGDSVFREHVPFLAEADIPQWLETLNGLKSPAFKDYTIVSGRDGIVTAEDIERTEHFLIKAGDAITDYAQDHETAEGMDALIKQFKPKDWFAVNEDHLPTAQERLDYGFRQYFTRHFVKVEENEPNETQNEEE